CRTATAIVPHISIEKETKTVKGGALWYEETLPPDTLLYVMLLANAARNSGTPPTLSGADVLKKVTDMFPGKGKSYLQIGGNETVGMGWCKVTGGQA
ncbi:MAG: RAMP superfamily CRISPR-associated protein, partial [Nitrospirota bacterium]|nr:RAMP superfamily CRISPR-associated protein [Nitrospirota bacterium]